ncbi:adenosylcobinamide amidohydrolase [Virgibacillus soli]
MIEIEHVSGGYAHETVVKDISFHVDKGEFFGIIGPNGSGKTTLVKMMSGILPTSAGNIQLKNRPISSYQPKALAQLMAVLPQHTSQTFSYTVKETISLGRYAYKKGLFQIFTEEDEQVVQDVMEQTGVASYGDDLLDQLSGGERQRVYLAQALAQQPEILLLDEPTNHLDLAYQKELLDLLRRWTYEKGLTVISIFHDLNLASLYCDRLLLMHQGKMKSCHVPEAVLKVEAIREVYRTDIEKYAHPKLAKPQIMLLPEVCASEVDNRKEKNSMISEKQLTVTKEFICLQSPIPLKTLSSGVTGAGMGWYKSFINRHVNKDYQCDDYKQEMIDYLQGHGLDANETVGMMTAVNLNEVAYEMVEGEDFSVFIVITAGVGNAIDAAFGENHFIRSQPGTINTWIFVNGKLTDEAYVQSIITATEAKASVLREVGIADNVTGTIATGTSTDSILIGATQQGVELVFGGPISPLGKLVGKGVYQCLRKALAKYQG